MHRTDALPCSFVRTLLVIQAETLVEAVYTMPEIKSFQEKWVKGRTYIYCVLGDEKDLDLKGLSQYGPIQKLTQEELFGY